MNKTSAESTLHKYEPVSIFEYTTENTKRKNYTEIWKRAFKKIKINRFISRLNKSKSTGFSGFSEETIELMQFSQSGISFTIVKSSSSFIILPYSIWYIVWIFLLILNMIYISFYGLFNSSFVEFDINSFESKYEIIVDLTFCIDILLSFNLAFFNNQNKLITSRKSIIITYIRKQFIADVLLSFPFGIYLMLYPKSINYNLFKYRQFIRLAKWFVLGKRLEYFYFVKSIDHFCSTNRTLAKFIQIMFVISLSLHTEACLIFLYEKDYGLPETSMIFKSNMVDKDEGEQYLNYLYWALTTLSTIGYGDNAPIHRNEKIICMAWMAAGVFVVSITVGQFTFIFNKMLASDTLLDSSLYFASQFCHSCQISGPLAKRLKMCIRDKQILSHKFNIAKFLTSIDTTMRYDIAMSLYSRAIRKVPFIIDKDPYFISFISFYLQFLQVEENDAIWHRFAFPDGIYFIVKGQVKLYYENHLFMIYKEKDYTGDIEYFYKIKRRFDAFAGSNTEILKLSSKNIEILKTNFPLYYQSLKQNVKQRKTRAIHELAQILLINECCAKGSFIIDKSRLKALEEEIKLIMFSMRPGTEAKTKLRDLFGLNLDVNYSIFQCKELFKILLNNSK